MPVFSTASSPATALKRRRAKRLGAGGCLAAFLLAASGPQALADSFRCGKQLIRTGDTETQVLARCGEPQSRDAVKREYWVNGLLQKVQLQRWHYHPAGGKLPREVLIYQGAVVGISLGDRR